MNDAPDPKRPDPQPWDFLRILALELWPLVIVGGIALVAVFA
jgi:hypothetical protein